MPAEDAVDLRRQCRAIQLALPSDAVFTHLTSAQLRGWWLPSVTAPLPIIACTNSTAPHHDRRGVYVRRCAIPSRHRALLDDVRIASAEWTIVELAETLALIDLVVVIDSALHVEHCTVDSIRDTMVPGRRGVRGLRRALSLVDARSESPWESILRLVHTLSGIFCVEPQYVVTDGSGLFVARVDLRIGNTRRAHEYDGGDHRDRERHRSDLRREKELARISWERYGFTAVEIHHRPAQIVGDAQEALSLPRDARCVRGWLGPYAASSLSDAGRSALRRRLRRFVRHHPPRSVNPHRSPSGAGLRPTGK